MHLELVHFIEVCTYYGSFMIAIWRMQLSSSCEMEFYVGVLAEGMLFPLKNIYKNGYVTLITYFIAWNRYESFEGIYIFEESSSIVGSVELLDI